MKHARILVLALVAALACAVAPALAKQGPKEGKQQQARTYTLPAEAEGLEGIAANQRTKQFFVTDRVNGTVFVGRLGQTGPLSVFLPGGQDGRTNAIGIKVDERRGLLVIAGGNTGDVFVYSLATRELVNRVALGGQFVNDVTITNRGDVYATESGDVDPGVFFIPASTIAGTTDTFEPIPVAPPVVPATGENAFNLNGIASAQSGRYVLFVQSATGKLFRLDTRTRETIEVPVATADPDGLENADGILLKGRELYVVRNSDQQVDVVKLSGRLDRGRVTRTITSREFETPTTIAILDGRLLLPNAEFTNPTPPFEVVQLKR